MWAATATGFIGHMGTSGGYFSSMYSIRDHAVDRQRQKRDRSRRGAADRSVKGRVAPRGWLLAEKPANSSTMLNAV